MKILPLFLIYSYANKPNLKSNQIATRVTPVVHLKVAQYLIANSYTELI